MRQELSPSDARKRNYVVNESSSLGLRSIKREAAHPGRSSMRVAYYE